MKNKIFAACAAGLIVLFTLFRVAAYGDPRDSVSMLDSASYLQTAQLPLRFPDFFTAQRAFTLPLILKLIEPAAGYHITLVSEPARTGTAPRAVIQPGLDRLAVLQMIVSILSWSMLAAAFYRRLRNPWVGLAGIALILLFAYTPQMADWDRLIMSESLAFSLFALWIGLTLELADVLANERRRPVLTAVLAAAWVIVLVLWTFTRDANGYWVLLAGIFLLGLLALRPVRERIRLGAGLGWLIGLAAVALAVFAFQQATFRASPRWVKPMLNNMAANVFPYPTRVAFFVQRGMPVSDKLLATHGSMEYNNISDQTEFMQWLRRDGFSAYSSFLVHTPAWAALSFYQNFDGFFVDNNQQSFFQGSPATRPIWLLPVGNLLHGTSGSIALIAGLLALWLAAIALQRGAKASELGWAWLGVWLFVGGMATTFIGFHGEVRSVARHVLVGIVPLRLSVWLMLAVLADGTLGKTKSLNREPSKNEGR